jgi:hypothetical protein
LVLRRNAKLQVECDFDDETAARPILSEQELAEELAHWHAANLNLWDDKIYSMHRIDGAARITFRSSRFFSYRATYGSLPDELALALIEHGFEKIRENKDLLLPKRKRFLSSADALLRFDNRICIGGPQALFAFRTDDDIAMIIQRRSNQVSDEPGVFVVVPKAIHQPTISDWDERHLEITLYRECYEELFGGIDRPSERRHLSHESFIAECPAIKELIERREQIHLLQPLGILWDFLRGNYHVVYCLFVHDPGWWKRHQASLKVNWEIDENIKPFLRASQRLRLHNFIVRKDWAPESYFTFIEGLRWLSEKDDRIAHIRSSLPELSLSPITPIAL